MAPESNSSQTAAAASIPAAEAGVADQLDKSTGDARADWSVPTWIRHPRLEGILGTRLADVGWEQIDDLVSRKVIEDLSVDFKQSHYVLDKGIGRAVLPKASFETIADRVVKDRFELAKDVTAFANAAGGLIVIGVADSNGRAERFTDVDLKDKQRLTYLDTLRTWTAPYLTGIEIGHVARPTDPDRGCVLIYVPPSADRPHAVVEPNSHRHTWYVRDGGHAAALSEAQIALSYRDRYSGRADVERQVQLIFEQGVRGLDRQNRVWLAAAVVPSTRAPRRHMDRHLLDEFKSQTLTRQDELPNARLGHHAAFGRSRVVLRDSPASVARATDHLVHLHLDGSAFAAVVLDTLNDTGAVRQRRPELSADVKCIRVGSITTWALQLAGISFGHAVDAGASGDFELVCGIVTATEEDPDVFSPESELPALHHVVIDQPWQSSPHENMVPETTWRDALTPVQVTASAVAASDLRELVAIGAQLVSELVAEFGHVPSDPLLSAEGLVVGKHCYGSRLEYLRDWAHWRGLLVEEQAN